MAVQDPVDAAMAQAMLFFVLIRVSRFTMLFGEQTSDTTTITETNTEI